MKASYITELLEIMELRQQLEKLARKYQDSGNPHLQFVARKINKGLEPIVESEMYLDGD